MKDSLLDFVNGIGAVEGNIAMATLMTVGALLTYIRIGFDRSEFKLPLGRSMIGVGLTMWSIRFWGAILNGIDLTVPPWSQISVSLFLFGYSLVQLKILAKLAIDAGLPTVQCLRDPDFVCTRHDRRMAALLRKNDRTNVHPMRRKDDRPRTGTG